MKPFYLFLVVAALIGGLLTGCSQKDNSEPPAPLTDIEDPEFIQILWRLDSGKGTVYKFVFLEPYLSGNKIFTVDTLGLVTQIDLESGKRDWTFETGLEAFNGLNGNGDALVVTSKNGDIAVYDIAKKELKLRWKKQIAAEIRTRPVWDGNEIFIRSVDGRISVLDALTGATVWSVTRTVPSLSLTGSSAPIVTPELVIAGFDNGKLSALDRSDGTELWEYTVTTPRGRSEIERLVDVDAQLLLKDNIIYACSFQGDLVAVSLYDGKLLWSREFSAFQAITADEDALYLTDDKSHVWSIDRRTGSAFWKQDEMHARKLTAPTQIGDKLVVADLEGWVHVLDKKDGKILTRIQTNEIQYLVAPLIYQDKILALDRSGFLTTLTQQHSKFR